MGKRFRRLEPAAEEGQCIEKTWGVWQPMLNI
jgi:hypothetical protein